MDKSSELEMDGGAAPASDPAKPIAESHFPGADQKNVSTPGLSNPTPASLTTAPQDELNQDQSVPDSFRVDPKHPPENNPFGSTGEAESDVDLHSNTDKNNPKPKDDQ